MSRLPLIGLGVAAALVVAGVAVIFWPASLIVAGVGLGWLSLVADDGQPS